MSEKTEEQIAKEKAAVEAMRNAKANMDAALARITDLERALENAAGNLSRAKQYIGTSCFAYTSSSSQRTVHDLIDEQVASARKALG